MPPHTTKNSMSISFFFVCACHRHEDAGLWRNYLVEITRPRAGVTIEQAARGFFCFYMLRSQTADGITFAL